MQTIGLGRLSRKGALITRIKLIINGGMRAGDYDQSLSSPYAGRVPTRCVFQFSAGNGSAEILQLEYVMRMMHDWAKNADCNPYVNLQNTGVSLLLQGYFDPPHGAPKAPISNEICNVVLKPTESTGLSLRDIDRIKMDCGVDTRPLQACLCASCFVRLPAVQLSFRFMGPSDPTRTSRIIDVAEESYAAEEFKRRVSARSDCALRRRTNVDTCFSEDDECDNEKSKRASAAVGRRRTRPRARGRPNDDATLENASTVAGGSLVEKLIAYFCAIKSIGSGRSKAGTATQIIWTVCVTSIVTLAMWMMLWCIKDGT